MLSGLPRLVSIGDAARRPRDFRSQRGRVALGLHSTIVMRSPLDYENRTLGQRGAGLAASRLAHSHSMIKEKAA
jgi:hypothetical protein